VEILRSEKILVVQTSFLGDAILSLPFVQQLKIKFPSSQIDVVTTPYCEEIFRASPAVTDIVIMDKRGEHKSILNTIRLAQNISKKKIRPVVLSARSFRTSLFAFFTRIKETTGLIPARYLLYTKQDRLP